MTNPLYSLAQSYSNSLVEWIRILNGEIERNGPNRQSATRTVADLWDTVNEIHNRLANHGVDFNFYATVHRMVDNGTLFPSES